MEGLTSIEDHYRVYILIRPFFNSKAKEVDASPHVLSRILVGLQEYPGKVLKHTVTDDCLVVILYEFRSDDTGVIEKLVNPLLTNSSCLQSEEAMSNLKLPPIDLVAMILEVETLNLVTAIDIEDDAIREERSLKETALSKLMVVGHWRPEDWESYWSGRVRIEGTVRGLSAALPSKQWSKGGAPLANRLLEELRTVLDRSRIQGEYVREGVQQIHTMASIEETRKGIQQSDSVRR